MIDSRTCEKREITPGPRAVAIGAFDGVHLGHQAVVTSVVNAASRLGIPSAALTFEPTPRQFFGRDESLRKRLTPDPERVQLLCSLGVQQVLVQTFDDDLRRMTPEQFVREILCERLEARFVGLGASHTFGAGRAAGPDRMAKLGREFGFEVEIVPLVSIEGATVSSTSVRAALATGDVAPACKLLGRPYAIAGRVVRGLGIGAGLGAPTANLQVPADKLLPAEGVYAAVAILADCDAAPVPAAAVIGPSPTFGVDESRVEAHLLDLDSDLYGRELAIGLLKRLRPIEGFPDTQALSDQIQRDCEETRRVFAEVTAAGSS
jgi:riboflavin kinase/FMN adenylyltransferase